MLIKTLTCNNNSYWTALILSLLGVKILIHYTRRSGMHFVMQHHMAKMGFYMTFSMIIQVHAFKKSCAKVYPSTVQNDIVWFWPNSEPQYKDIITKKTPLYIPEMDDPSYIKTIRKRDLPYGYANIYMHVEPYIS